MHFPKVPFHHLTVDQFPHRTGGFGTRSQIGSAFNYEVAVFCPIFNFPPVRVGTLAHRRRRVTETIRNPPPGDFKVLQGWPKQKFCFRIRETGVRQVVGFGRLCLINLGEQQNMVLRENVTLGCCSVGCSRTRRSSCELLAGAL